MKKILIIVLISGILLGGCSISGDISENMKSPAYPENETTEATEKQDGASNISKENDANEKENEADEVAPELIFSEFINMVNDGKKPSELKAYMDSEISKLPVDKADEMILAFEEIQSVYEGYYQRQVLSGEYAGAVNRAASKGIGSDIIDRIEVESLKNLLKEVFNGGYKLIEREGSIYPVQDYSLLKAYSSYLSPQVSEYINVKAAESDKPIAIDGALAVSWDELAERLLKMEEFIEAYPDFPRYKGIANRYNFYIRFYLTGIDNTPAYDHSTKKYKDEVIASFKKLINEHGDSQTAKWVKEFLDMLEANDYMYSDQVRNSTMPAYKNAGEFNPKYVSNYLARLLPDMGYKWLYNGFAEYGHQMSLEDIVKDDEGIKYIIRGKVADMSDGESGRSEDDFSIELTYNITWGSIYQEKKEKMMMDSDMDFIELIRAPLVEGNKWAQIAIDKEGNERHLECQITDINKVGGAKVYTVEYRDMYSDYYEIRMIEEKVGVVSFTKLWITEDGNFEIGYSLYKDASGY
jgi:hypothetical protein